MYPDSSMTGAWSNAFSFRISTAFWQDTDGNTVRRAGGCRHWTVMLHHLREREREKLVI